MYLLDTNACIYIFITNNTKEFEQIKSLKPETDSPYPFSFLYFLNFFDLAVNLPLTKKAPRLPTRRFPNLKVRSPRN
jgi:hypothetical protein